ncbi:uncharacterized protein LOC111382134 [Olea europaea var. sylvestris]|uniref:uncharacterized protein LOC111382134 n=1 Tax=Olea europaea var. sylvestris TaxID=158386 RepID=UPI000C1D5DB3|nr:uncharacterized protein LOC111382134 [Olea europaea var. sylvestris]
MDKYFPQSLRDFKESEFLRLKHGNMSLIDYERKFDQLSRYALHLVDTKIKKTRRFEQGLNPDLSMILMSNRFTSYREMLERAHAIWYQKANAGQRRQLYNQRDRAHIGKKKWNGQDKGKGKWQNKKANIRSSASKAIVATVAPCLKCGKPHRGECLYGKNAYFRCGKPGHIAKHCPMFTQKKDDNSDQNKMGKARVFALTQKDAEENSNVITGILLIFNTPACVLITCEKSESTLEVSVPSGRTLNTDQLARSREGSVFLETRRRAIRFPRNKDQTSSLTDIGLAS